MSKTRNRQQRRWTTTERERYAIYMTLKKYEYLVRDIPFELYTDHESLVYLNNPPSNKVMRWKLAIQEYNCTIDYIKGELNIVADGLSRLTEELPVRKIRGRNHIMNIFRVCLTIYKLRKSLTSHVMYVSMRSKRVL